MLPEQHHRRRRVVQNNTTTTPAQRGSYTAANVLLDVTHTASRGVLSVPR